MALNLQPSTPSIIRLDLATWRDQLRNYITARQKKKAAAAEVYAMDKLIDPIKALLKATLGGAPAAVCGQCTLTAKTTEAQAAALTLHNGRRILWSDVTHMTVGNETIRPEDVKTLFGGRSATTDFVPEGTP